MNRVHGLAADALQHRGLLQRDLARLFLRDAVVGFRGAVAQRNLVRELRGVRGEAVVEHVRDRLREAAGLIRRARAEADAGERRDRRRAGVLRVRPRDQGIDRRDLRAEQAEDRTAGPKRSCQRRRKQNHGDAGADDRPEIDQQHARRAEHGFDEAPQPEQ